MEWVRGGVVPGRISPVVAVVVMNGSSRSVETSASVLNWACLEVALELDQRETILNWNKNSSQKRLTRTELKKKLLLKLIYQTSIKKRNNFFAVSFLNDGKFYELEVENIRRRGEGWKVMVGANLNENEREKCSLTCDVIWAYGEISCDWRLLCAYVNWVSPIVHPLPLK